MAVSGQNDPLELKTNEQLLLFLRRKKTEISCIEQPHAFLTQLRDHDLLTEKLFEKVKEMRYSDEKQERVYEVLDQLEKEKSQCMHHFWRCLFEDHILQRYPTFQRLRNSLLDGTFEFHENFADVETRTEKSKGKGEKGKERKNIGKRNKDDRIGEDSGNPGPSSASTPNQEKPAMKPSFSSPGEGKENCKNWKVKTGNTTLKKLIEEVDFLEADQKKETHHQSPPMKRRRSTCAPKEEMTDLSVFGPPSLPVICVSLTGTLYKDRFASGSRGKSIRTEESWFTPEEFVKQESSLTDGHWKKDILCHGKTLNFLVKEEILRIHILCDCRQCSDKPKDLMAQKNDDVCYVCHSEGDLVCCDDCPRAFHPHCHLPAVDGDSPGEWICTFCVFRTSQQWRVSSSMTEQEAFDAPVSQYRLHCYYLLLCVYREDTQRVFVKDPRKTVSRYSQFIAQPMWLDRIKLKLESDKYQTVKEFVSDFRLIFSNCRLFNRDNEFGQMGARLKEMFEKEFQKIFTIQ